MSELGVRDGPQNILTRPSLTHLVLENMIILRAFFLPETRNPSYRPQAVAEMISGSVCFSHKELKPQSG